MIDDNKVVPIDRKRQARELSDSACFEVGLKDGGGGGTSGDGMEPRIARLEADMEHVKKSLDEVRADVREVQSGVADLRVGVGRLEERVAHLPTIVQMWSGAVAIVVALGAVIALAVRFIPHVG